MPVAGEIMDASRHTSYSERFGHWAGRMWRGYLHGERQAVTWLVTRGVPARAATVVLWIIKLGVFVVLFYVAFWLALLVAFAVVAAWVARSTDWHEPPPWYEPPAEPEWRDGPVGYGLYTYDDQRIDPHVDDDD